ncbi:hypothetical protein J6590_065647 [Homalodisca vitripennis]|nr:hypothetical protein J6590_065647 [Homalodisca vitripennis]
MSYGSRRKIEANERLDGLGQARGPPLVGDEGVRTCSCFHKQCGRKQTENTKALGVLIFKLTQILYEYDFYCKPPNLRDHSPKRE